VAAKKFRVLETLCCKEHRLKIYRKGDIIELETELEIKRLLMINSIVPLDSEPEMERVVIGPPEKRRGRPKQ
jgi:hypothetical protein